MCKCMFLLIAVLCATSVKSADSLYIYGANGREYYLIDTTRILIKWGVEPDALGGSGFLTAYPSVDATNWTANKIDRLVLHNLTGSYNFQSVVSQLRSDTNVESVNEVLVVSEDENLFLFFGNTIICRFPSGTAQTLVDSICTANHLAIESESQYVPRQYVLKRLASATLSTREVANYLHDLPSTTWAQPDWKGSGTALGYTVSDEYFHFTQWNIKKTIGYKSTANYGAWEVTSGSSTIRVAVLDQGMEPHEDFDTSKWDQGLDFTPTEGIDFDPSPITPEPPNFTDAHGMAVLGIIAAAHNNPVIISDEQGGSMYSSTAGMAPLTRIIPLRIIDPEGFLVEGHKVEDALYYAAVTADIINCSWGMSPVPLGVQSALTFALSSGRNGKGCIIVASSGNTPLTPMRFPAINDSVIVVGAIGQNDRVLYYSEGGPTLDVIAPSTVSCGKNGVICQDSANSYYTVDRADILGYNPKYFGSCYPSQDKDYTCTFSGTSAAAPAVSGEVALLLALDSNLTRVQVIDIVRRSANKIDLDTAQGLQVDEFFYGQGRANAVRALSTVRRGDCNASGNINVVDVTHLVAFLFQSGQEPFPDKYFGDASCDGNVNVVDVVKLTGYLFRGGPAPQNPCTAFQLDYE